MLRKIGTLVAEIRKAFYSLSSLHRCKSVKCENDLQFEHWVCFRMRFLAVLKGEGARPRELDPPILKPRCAVWTLSRMAEFVYIVPRRYISKIFKMAAAYSCWPRCMRPLAIFWVKHFVDLGRPKQKSKQNADGPSGL